MVMFLFQIINHAIDFSSIVDCIKFTVPSYLIRQANLFQNDNSEQGIMYIHNCIEWTLFIMSSHR